MQQVRNTRASNPPGRGTTVARQRQQGSVLVGLAATLFVAAGGMVGGYVYLSNRPAPAVAVPVAKPVDGATRAATATAHGQGPQAAAAWHTALDQRVTLDIAGHRVQRSWRELGATISEREANLAGGVNERAQLAKRGSLPVILDRDKTHAALRALKAQFDRAPTNAFLDLENRTIVDERAGRGIDIWATLTALESAARAGATTLTVPTVELPAQATRQSLGIDDISMVLGTYTTKFSVADKDRNFNLKLAASKLNGFVLAPGVEFSFNGIVGERSEKMGYKIAHVIDAGEMVDGLAGGTCQISTTLFGAAFFAGLEIVKTTNHSRPSTYTPLGFDATVVWPNTDLKLRNPYDFPVVIHYRVANGEANVTLLGKKRPYDKIVFERKVIESTPYSTEERLDDAMPKDQTSTDQGGFDGYKLLRYRRFFRGDEEVKSEKWTVEYKPVTEYIRRGTSEDPNAKMPPPKDIHLPKAPDSDEFKLAQ